MRPLVRHLLTGVVVLGVATPAATAATLAQREQADLTAPTTPLTAVARGDGFTTTCGSDSCTIASSAEPFVLQVPTTSSGEAVVTVTLAYRTTGAGRFGAFLELSDGHIDHRRARLAPAERRDTRTIMFRVSRLTPGQTLTGGLGGFAATVGARTVSIEGTHVVVRVDYL